MSNFLTGLLSLLFWALWVIAIYETWGSDTGDPYGAAICVGIAAILSKMDND